MQIWYAFLLLPGLLEGRRLSDEDASNVSSVQAEGAPWSPSKCSGTYRKENLAQVFQEILNQQPLNSDTCLNLMAFIRGEYRGAHVTTAANAMKAGVNVIHGAQGLEHVGHAMAAGQAAGHAAGHAVDVGETVGEMAIEGGQHYGLDAGLDFVVEPGMERMNERTMPHHMAEMAAEARSDSKRYKAIKGAEYAGYAGIPILAGVTIAFATGGVPVVVLSSTALAISGYSLVTTGFSEAYNQMKVKKDLKQLLCYVQQECKVALPDVVLQLPPLKEQVEHLKNKLMNKVAPYDCAEYLATERCDWTCLWLCAGRRDTGCGIQPCGNAGAEEVDEGSSFTRDKGLECCCYQRTNGEFNFLQYRDPARAEALREDLC
eukprot:TRINITY_DN111542_c0_g1_i1.p1 TRINITY_DN111542_c0_g1~~TRINITY_DN111542_c0_g1_i1.p1  ORF type:complete len:374 (-),score=55.08 TRINITY_DN111542_c0_g1_i1:80-1201(-)